MSLTQSVNQYTFDGSFGKFQTCQMSSSSKDASFVESIFSDKNSKTILEATATLVLGGTGFFMPSNKLLTKGLKFGMFVAAGIFAAKTIYDIWSNNKPNLKICVLDDFESKNNKPSHGDKVCNIISSGLSNAEIERVQIKEDDVLNSFRKILKDVKNGKKYDAINFSQAYDIVLKLDDIKIYDKDRNRIKITSYNILDYKNEIREYIEKNLKENNPNDYEMISELIEIIEELTDRGIKIFQSNGNNCAEELSISDVWDFNKKYENSNNPNLITVSASDSSRRHTELSDIHKESKFYNADTKETYEGNSFASPKALVDFFQSK